jgi:hypothetical protein
LDLRVTAASVRRLYCGFLCCVTWKKFTDVSEVFAASIIRSIIIAGVSAVLAASETSENSVRLHGGTTQKTL